MPPSACLQIMKSFILGDGKGGMVLCSEKIYGIEFAMGSFLNWFIPSPPGLPGCLVQGIVIRYAHVIICWASFWRQGPSSCPNKWPCKKLYRWRQPNTQGNDPAGETFQCKIWQDRCCRLVTDVAILYIPLHYLYVWEIGCDYCGGAMWGSDGWLLY